MLTDPVADMLARLKNANKALHEWLVIALRAVYAP